MHAASVARVLAVEDAQRVVGQAALRIFAELVAASGERKATRASR